ncbi:MAG TPA: phosphate signaling complex protein PhoU [Ferruginibacter sp.]|nr:phosphate signaling complex protein PhoU [Ferruginibacter sp.]
MTHLQEQLDFLKKALADMASLVESQLQKSINALLEQDEDLANEVLHNEKRVNAYELKIDKDCENIFALLTPVAHDMRLVFATLKINADLERIGDYAEGISKIVVDGKKGFDFKLVQNLNLKHMFDIVFAMFKDVIVSYCENDSRLARSVFSRDLLVNDLNHKAMPIVVEFCKENNQAIPQAIELLSIMRKLERVGDHITNIAEEVIFFKEAQVLKHGNKGGDNSADFVLNSEQ